MGMSTHVVGIKPADEKYAQMHKILELCRTAKIDPPQAVKDFFGHYWKDSTQTDPSGVCVSLDKGSPGVTEWNDRDRGGYEVDLRKLDPDIKILRFYNSR